MTRRMANLEKWSFIAEITGGIAIVISVVILIVEVRGNTAAIRAASAQSITDATTDVMMLMVTDDDFTRLRLAGDRTVREPLLTKVIVTPSDSTLSELDLARYFFFLRQQWIRYQNIYLQTQAGTLDPSVWETYSGVICFDMMDPSRPGVKATWPDHSGFLNPEFVNIVESCPGF